MKLAEKILEAISQTARKVFPNGEGEVYLYGSRARGDARKNSDWDLIVITDDKPDNDENFRKYAFPFAELGWDFNAQITPLLFSKHEWEQNRGTLFYLNVQTDAIRI